MCASAPSMRRSRSRPAMPSIRAGSGRISSSMRTPPLADLVADLRQERRGAGLRLAHQAQPVGRHLLEDLTVVGVGGLLRLFPAFARALAIVRGALDARAS